MTKHYEGVIRMNIQIAKGAMKELKGELKHTWAKLTDDDLSYLDGSVDQIIGKVQKAYGYSKEKAVEEFDKFKIYHTTFFRDDRDFDINRENLMATASQLNGQMDVNKFKKQASHMIEEDILEPAQEYFQKVKDMGIQVVDRTNGLVRENPKYAILGAATAGFLAGAYFFRRK
jgi:uncharacterized protein YjbJ (UPF0337 family)/ElaB/YqjD/DUF883 family membrane-anchored ribosome-binding protein